MRGYILGMLLKKDFKDLLKNMSVIPIVIMAPFLAYIYSFMDEVPGEHMLPIWTLYGIAMVGIMLPGLAVAEEKEKKTLDSLLVSPATSNEIIVSKVIFSLLMIILVTILVLWPNGGLVGNMYWISVGVLLGATFFVQIGLIIGLFTENQVSAGAFMTPAMLVSVLAPMFLFIMPPFLRKVFEYLPSIAVLEVVGGGMAGMGRIVPNLLILLAWNGVAYIFTLLGIRRQFQ